MVKEWIQIPQEQIDVIRQRYEHTDQWLKAPNGKSSNLDEQAWLEVRTPVFKEVFGDWEKGYRIEKALQAPAIAISGDVFEYSEDAKEYKNNALAYGKLLRGEYTNLDTDTIFIVNRASIQEILRHDFKDIHHIKSVEAIPQIIKNAIYVDTLTNEDLQKHGDVSHYDYYFANLTVDDRDYFIKAVMARAVTGNLYYDHKLTDKEKNRLEPITLRVSTAGTGTNLLDIDDKRLLQILQVNYSKFLDNNGEPLTNIKSVELLESFNSQYEAIVTYDGEIKQGMTKEYIIEHLKLFTLSEYQKFLDEVNKADVVNQKGDFDIDD